MLLTLLPFLPRGRSEERRMLTKQVFVHLVFLLFRSNGKGRNSTGEASRELDDSYEYRLADQSFCGVGFMAPDLLSAPDKVALPGPLPIEIDPEKAGEHCFSACNHVLGKESQEETVTPQLDLEQNGSLNAILVSSDMSMDDSLPEA
jgi:hypothetical protein